MSNRKNVKWEKCQMGKFKMGKMSNGKNVKWENLKCQMGNVKWEKCQMGLSL